MEIYVEFIDCLKVVGVDCVVIIFLGGYFCYVEIEKLLFLFLISGVMFLDEFFV